MLIEDFFRCKISALDETISDFNHLIVVIDWLLADIAVDMAHGITSLSFSMISRQVDIRKPRSRGFHPSFVRRGRIPSVQQDALGHGI